MTLKNIIFSEVMQARNTVITCTHSYVIFEHKAKTTSLQTTIPENLDNDDNTKRD